MSRTFLTTRAYRNAYKRQAYLMQKVKMQRQTSARAEWLTVVASVLRGLPPGKLFHF